ncbi:MAG: serine/threonine protein kinase [Deltaproteobacteria bacterium]|nr:serine/threonine protein kinase [Deltaproteobacteria bacterium]
MLEAERAATELAGTLVATAAHAYRIARPIAQGGFSVVFRARRSDPVGDERERDVAIKVLDVEHLRDRLTRAPPAFLDPDAPLAQQMAEVRARFVNEAHLLRTLRHPNIVRALDEGILPPALGRAPFYVMEYLPGTDVGEIVRLRGSFDLRASCAITGAVLSALGHLERKGVVHRDVKAANVFVQPSARAAPATDSIRLIDFGLATAVTRNAGRGRVRLPHDVRTRPGMLWGTLAWCPPERMAPFLSESAEQENETHLDLWGAGLLLYLCLTGVQPFEREHFATDTEQFAAIVEGRLPAPRALVPSLPASLDAVARKALAPRPAERFGSAGEFLEALRAC